MSQPHPSRAVAARNRERILDAARAEVAARGADAGMDQIAATAGVAVGTLYRHFATKAALLEAVMADYATQVTTMAEQARRRTETGNSAAAVIVEFLHDVLEATATNQAVKNAARTLGAGGIDEAEQARAATALDTLLARGRDEGTVAADLTVADIYLLITTAPTDQPAPARARWLDLVLRGLVTSTSRPVPDR